MACWLVADQGEPGVGSWPAMINHFILDCHIMASRMVV
jgi:hypothetical protein